ncbi:MAG: ATP-dependent DNA helicase [Sphaerochaetaceae bacterium]
MSDLPGIYDFFDEGGILSKAFDGFEFRDGQLQMSLLVQKAYEENAIAVIEAGTGIGKSFAYLVPALINSRKHDEIEKTVIATATKNLQLQLSSKDIPQLFDASGESCNVCVLFGRSNYICIRRLEEILRSDPLFSDDQDTEIGKLKHFASETETGLFQDIHFRISEELISSCSSDPDFCYGGKCPYMRECFYFKAKRAATRADIIITNHHLLFTDAASRMESGCEYSSDGGVLPAFSRLVIDEAHNIEQNATDLFSGVYSGYNVSRQMNHILANRYGKNESMLDTLGRFCTDDTSVPAIKEQANSLKIKMSTLDVFLSSLLQDRKLTSLLIQDPKSEGLAPFYPVAEEVVKQASVLVSMMKDFAKNLKYSEDDELFVDGFTSLVSRVDSAFATLEQFTDKDHWTDDVHFIRMIRVKKELVFEICISPVSIADKMRQSIFAKLKTVICTSATLNLNDDFAYWSSRVGLPATDRQVLKLTVQSPFDYEHYLLLLTPSDAPEFKESESEAFTAYVASATLEAISSSGGGALVLFTSYKMMQDVYARIHLDIEKQKINTMIQGTLGRFQLLKDFKEDADSVLFATSSFWEGIDAPGNTLRLVIIVKLPFQAPTEPILKARVRRIEEEGGSGFFQLSLPDATMKLKQGFGRLIRNKTDKGIVLILDSRVITKNYGQYMLHALPPSYNPETDTKGISDKIENFLFSGGR